ncbi:MAG: xylulokinase, partial [Oscillospiraceae bacterium]|nr:xylulokinase [Oscillospiraceae bacterium]
GTKTALFDTSGALAAAHTEDYPMSQPRNGWAEQDPEDWWRAAVLGIRAVLRVSGAAAADIAGIGLSGQMHGLVMLDKSGAVLRPAILWCDQRTAAECGEINELVGAARVLEITANPPTTGFTASKILWVRRHEPEVYARCAHILLPKDYVRYRLTGELATEVSDASGTQLLDVPRRAWSGEVLARLQIDRALLPAVYESPDVTGAVHTAAASETGLAAGIPVVGGAGDNAAAAVGTGIVREGAAFTSLGSSAVIYAVTDTPRVDMRGRVHGLCAASPGKWTLMSCTQGAGLSLQWLRKNVCPELTYAEMDALAAGVPVGAEKLLFLPYLMGERSPHPDADCRGVFFGLAAMHGRGHMIRAVLEGVAYSQRECLDVFAELGGAARDMTAVGGGARSALWRQMLADLYACPVHTSANADAAALGAALLAAVGAGVYASVEEADARVRIPERGSDAAIPDAARGAAYAPYYALYKSLYGVLRESFGALGRI